ncbi:MAG: hypothetical protein JO179_04480 [Solirubrobacterales bacterium]|nr:hypothetical protein [Solirubrobacterales bacterium]
MLPIAEVPLDDRLRAALDKTEGGTPLIVGLRPEHLFDAALVDDGHALGVTFQTRVDVLEAMGAEYYAYSALEDPAGASELRTSADDDRESVGRRRPQLVARLSIDSTVCEREPIELWFDPRRLHIFECETGKRLTDSVR